MNTGNTALRANTRYIAWLFVITCSFFALPTIASAQEPSIPDIPADIGPLDEIHPEVGRLFCLDIDKQGKIALARDVWKVNARRDMKLRRRQSSSFLRHRALDPPEFEESDPSNIEGFTKAVNQLVLVLNHTGEMSSGGGSSVSAEYRGREFKFRHSRRESTLAFHMYEQQDAERYIRVFDDPETGRFTMQVKSHRATAKIKQGPDQFIFNMKINGKSFAAQTSSFAEFASSQPELHDRLTTLYTAAGISMPPDEGSRELAAVVRKQLMDQDILQQSRAEHLVALLESKSYTERKFAVQELTKGFTVFEDRLKRTLETRQLKPETRKSLLEVLRVGAAQSLCDPRIAALIEEKGLMESVEYLVGLLESSDAASNKGVLFQLTQLTGQSFGDQPEKWKNWLKENASSK